MKQIAWFWLCCLILYQQKGFGQPVSENNDSGWYDSSRVIGRDQVFERLFDRSLEDEENSQLLEQFLQLQQRKLNVNTASFDQLLELPFLTAHHVQAIIAYRTEQGPLETLDQLSAVLDKETLEIVSNFLVAEPRDDMPQESEYRKPRSKRFSQTGFEYLGRTLFDVPEREGFPNGKYLGSEPKIYNRMQASFSERYFVSALIEKDIGEQSLADFSSASFQISNLYHFSRIVLGDYNLRFGQGLAITSSRFFFKSGETVLATKQAGSQLSAYTSTAEQNFFRGAAVQAEFGEIGLTGFFSKNYFDATLTDSGFSSLRYDGLHRTETEIEKEDNVSETLYGIHLEYNRATTEKYWHFGGTVYSGYYNKPAAPEEDLTNLYSFQGRRFSVGSVEADVLIGNLNFFGEWAYSVEQKADSWLAGLIFDVQKNVRTVVLVRDYDKSFFSPHASAFAEDGTDARNEFGVYLGLEATLWRGFQVRAYYDAFRFPFIDASAAMPGSGDDMRLELSYSLTKNVLIETLLQRKTYEDALTQTDALGQEYRAAVPVLSERIRTDLICRLSEQVRLKTRAEVKHVRKTYLSGDENDMGWMAYEQVEYDSKNRRFSLEARISVFDTDSYDAAIYAYENDLPLLITVTALSGTGRRIFLNLRYQVLPGLEVAFRYANTFRDDVETVGTGNDAKKTNSPSLVSVGLRASF